MTYIHTEHLMLLINFYIIKYLQNCLIGMFNVSKRSFERATKVAASCNNDATRFTKQRSGRYSNIHLLGQSSFRQR